MSWNILEKSKNGIIQYLVLNYSLSLRPIDEGVNTDIFCCLGYSNMTISYNIDRFTATNVKVILQGSNDGINYFDIETNTHTNTDNGYLKSSSPVKYIRVYTITDTSSGANSLTSIHCLLSTQ